MLADFMDAGHVALQTLAIRRLLEEKQSNPRGQIISLRRVVAAVKGNRGLIMRENFVCHDGLPYDPEPGGARALASAAEKPDEMHWIATEGSEDWDMAETLHEAFDTLSGVSRDRRSRGDLIRVAYFDEMEAQLEDPAFAALEAYANNFVAHSADERSREVAGDDIDVTIERTATCNAAIIKVFHALIPERPIPQPGPSLDRDRPADGTRSVVDSAYERPGSASGCDQLGRLIATWEVIGCVAGMQGELAPHKSVCWLTLGCKLTHKCTEAIHIG